MSALIRFLAGLLFMRSGSGPTIARDRFTRAMFTLEDRRQVYLWHGSRAMKR